MQIRSSFILFAFPLLLLCSAAVTSAASIRRPGSIGFQDASEPFNKRMGPEELREQPEAVLKHLLGISTQWHQKIREMIQLIKNLGIDHPDARKVLDMLKEDENVTFKQMMDILDEIDVTQLRL